MNQIKTTLKTTLLAVLSISFGTNTKAQSVAKKIVVEHFTNSRCGICASRNPGLFSTIAKESNIIQISFHPSSPYSSCVLNQYNKAGNDGRTNFYGLYGSTPKIAINGIPTGGSFTSSTLFDNYRNQTTSFEMISNLVKMGDSFISEVKIKKIGTSSLTAASLYVFAAEDSLNYNAPNGEKLHHNVYRSTFGEGMVNLPSVVGDSVTYRYALKVDPALKEDKMHSIALLQNNKELIQASRSGETKMDQTNSQKRLVVQTLELYPNPSTGVVLINPRFVSKTMVIYNTQGKEVKRLQIATSKVNLSDLSKGVYSFTIADSEGLYQGRVLLNN